MNNIKDEMNNKICIVTGATSGIGQVTARVLAEKGATVIIVGRNKEKCVQTVDNIRNLTNNSKVEFILADLSILNDVKSLAKQFLKKYDRLDVLVNNAGVSIQKRQETIDGIEATFAINHLSHFLLTNLLLDVIKSSAPARIINVSSALHTRTPLNFDDLEGKIKYGGMNAYGKSKLANVLFTYELARRLEGTGVTVNAVHPGLVSTNLSSNSGGFAKIIWKIITIFALSAEQGAESSIYLATSPEMEGITGKYYSKMKMVPSSKDSYDEKNAKRLWDVSLKMTGIQKS